MLTTGTEGCPYAARQDFDAAPEEGVAADEQEEQHKHSL
jgi:hypothetical protein